MKKYPNAASAILDAIAEEQKREMRATRRERLRLRVQITGLRLAIVLKPHASKIALGLIAGLALAAYFVWR